MVSTVLELKGNQGEIYDDVKLHLDTQLNTLFKNISDSVHRSLNGDHGRIESREVWLTTELDWLVARLPRWNSLKSIAVICSTREVNGVISYEQRYYLSSHKDAAFIADAIRTH